MKGQVRTAIQPESTGLELARSSRGVTTPVPCVYLPVSLTAPGSSGSAEPARLCRGCSRLHRRPPARTSSSFTPAAAAAERSRSSTSIRNNSASWRTQAALSFNHLLRQVEGGGLSPPHETTAPRGALTQLVTHPPRRVSRQRDVFASGQARWSGRPGQYAAVDSGGLDLYRQFQPGNNVLVSV
jgi:hypothetical protein